MSTQPGESSASGTADRQETTDGSEQRNEDTIHRSLRGHLRLKIPRLIRQNVVDVPGQLSNRPPAPPPAPPGLGILQTSASQAQRQEDQAIRPIRPPRQLSLSNPTGEPVTLADAMRAGDGTNENEQPPAYTEYADRRPYPNIAETVDEPVPAAKATKASKDSAEPHSETRDVFQWARMHDQLRKDNQARKEELSSFIAEEEHDQPESSTQGAAGPLTERSAAESNVVPAKDAEAIEAAAAVTLRKPPFRAQMPTAQGDVQMRTLEEAAGIMPGTQTHSEQVESVETPIQESSISQEAASTTKDVPHHISAETSALPSSISPDQILEETVPADSESLRTPPPSQKRVPSISPTPSGQREDTKGRKWSRFSWALRSKARSKSKDEEYGPTDPRQDDFENSPITPDTPMDSSDTSGPSRRQSSRTSVGSAMMMHLMRWKHSRGQSSAGDQNSPILEERKQSHISSSNDVANDYESGMDAGIEVEKRRSVSKLRDMAKRLFDTRKKPQSHFPDFSQMTSQENNLINESAQLARERRTLPRSWRQEAPIPESEGRNRLRRGGPYSSSPGELARAMHRVDLSRLRKQHSISYKGRRYTVQFPLLLEDREQTHPAMHNPGPMPYATPQEQVLYNKVRFEQIARSNILDAHFQEARTVGASSRESGRCRHGTF